MTIYLINPYTRQPAAAIEENENGRTLEIFDKDLQRCVEINGITQSEKRHGVWRVFPDGNPQFFLEAFEKDFYPTLTGKGYCWMTKEMYDAGEEAWIQMAIKAVFKDQ